MCSIAVLVWDLMADHFAQVHLVVAGGSGLTKPSPVKPEASGCISVVYPAVDSDGSDR